MTQLFMSRTSIVKVTRFGVAMMTQNQSCLRLALPVTKALVVLLCGLLILTTSFPNVTTKLTILSEAPVVLGMSHMTQIMKHVSHTTLMAAPQLNKPLPRS